MEFFKYYQPTQEGKIKFTAYCPTHSLLHYSLSFHYQDILSSVGLPILPTLSIKHEKMNQSSEN